MNFWQVAAGESCQDPLVVRRLRLAERLTDSTERKLLSTATLFLTSAEKLSLIHPSATLLAKHLFSQQYLADHHAVSAQVSPFSIDSIQHTAVFAHFDLWPLKRLPYTSAPSSLRRLTS